MIQKLFRDYRVYIYIYVYVHIAVGLKLKSVGFGVQSLGFSAALRVQSIGFVDWMVQSFAA